MAAAARSSIVPPAAPHPLTQPLRIALLVRRRLSGDAGLLVTPNVRRPPHEPEAVAVPSEAERRGAEGTLPGASNVLPASHPLRRPPRAPHRPARSLPPFLRRPPMKYTRFFPVLGLFACVALAGCADTDRPATDLDESSEITEPTQPANTILTVAEDAGLTTFRTAVAQAGLDETLGGPGPFTVFAPSDEAFNALPEGTLESLLETGNRDQLRQSLTYHVLPRQIMSGDLSGEMSIASQEGQSL